MYDIKLEESLTQSNTFAALRFILIGFDPLSLHKIGLKLVNGGGIDVGHYGPDCTHVIVDKLVYDDPICVAARKDEKVLVTGLWVDHSFDLGVPVDPTSVMYRPLKGRDGIPGAKDLIICLTGYQRQDRNDIMTMVGLMGANFSKPLVANKVTHLICYKFEGEKYDLAWKMKKIKLINHLWLEDCLKAWEILPEDDYSKSGYELEMMEAEAKDSEDEGAAEEPVIEKIKETKIVGSPNPLTIKARVSPQSKDNFLHTLPTSSASKSFPHVSNNGVSIPSSGKERVSAKNLNNQEFDKEHTNVFGHQGLVDIQGVTYDEPCAKSPTSVKVGSNLATNSDAVKLKSGSYFKKVSRSNLSSYSNLDLDKFNTSDGFDNPFPRELAKVGTDTEPVRSLTKEEGSLLYGKRKMDISCGKSKSPKTDRDSKACSSGSPSSSNIGGKAPIQPVLVNDGVDKNTSPGTRYTSPIRTPTASSCHGYSSPVNIAKNNTHNTRLKSLSTSLSKLMEPQMSSVEPEIISPTIEHGTNNIMDKVENKSIDAVKPQRNQKDVQIPSPKAKILGLDKSGSPMDTFKGNGSDSIEKPVRKKVVANRTWSSGQKARPKVGLIKAKSQKASIYLKDFVSPSIAGNDDGEKFEQLPSDANVDKARVVKTNNVEPLEKKYVDMMGYTDDQTEAPEDKIEDEVHAIPGLDEAVETNEVNLVRTECKIPSTTKTDYKSEATPLADEGGTISENVSGEKNELDEPAINKGGELEKSTKPMGKRKSFTLAPGKSRSLKCTLPRTKKTVEKSKSETTPFADGGGAISENEARGEKSEFGEPAINKGGDDLEKSTKSSGKRKSLTFTPGKSKSLKCTIPSTEETDDKSKSEATVYAVEGGAKSDSEISSEKNGLVGEPDINKGGELEKPIKSLSKRKSHASAPGKRKSLKCIPVTEKTDNKLNSEATPYADKDGDKSENEVSSEKNGLDEPDFGQESELEKTKLLNKRKSISTASGKKISKEEARRKESENIDDNYKSRLKKDKSSQSMRTKAERTASLEHAENSTVLEKENRPVGKRKPVPLVSGKRKSKEVVSREESKTKKNNQKNGQKKEKKRPVRTTKTKDTPPSEKSEGATEIEKENRPSGIGTPNVGQRIAKAATNFKNTSAKSGPKAGVTDHGLVLGALNTKSEPTCFILTGHKLQRKEFQQVIKRLRGRVCRDSHKWSYQATHFINPDPLRRTEKFFAAAASGRWILKTDYLTACNQAEKFLAEEPYEWHKKCLSEDGAINLEAPRRWRCLREKTGHGALYGMRVVIYGECISPSLETLKRGIKAGDGTILATSPPYTRFLNSGVDYAIVSPGMPRVDVWVQEFLRNEIPCVVADYLVEYVCKPGYPLERHVQYNTQAWAEKSFANLQIRSKEIVLETEMETETETHEDDVSDDIDIPCVVCGSTERGDVMLICGDESASIGCGVGTHIDCCNPPLERIPEEDWFCSKCSGSKKSKNSSRTTKKGRSLSKQKECLLL